MQRPSPFFVCGHPKVEENIFWRLSRVRFTRECRICRRRRKSQDKRVKKHWRIEFCELLRDIEGLMKRSSA